MYYSGNWVQIASAEKKRGSDTSLRARAEINSHFGESAGGQMRGAATQAMPDIVEDPDLRSGRALRAAARRPATAMRSHPFAPRLATRFAEPALVGGDVV